MSEFFDATSAIREQEDLALIHRRHGELTEETISAAMLLIAIGGLLALWLVLR